MPRAQREILILEVAGQVFARGGYHATSMDEIAELADVSKPMLYAYFGSKEGLYVAYIDGMGRELVERLVAAGRDRDAAQSRLSARINEFLAFVEEHRDGWTVLFREASASAPFAQEVAQLRTQVMKAVKRMIEGEAAAASWDLPAPAADGLAAAIVGAGESLANWWLEQPEVRREEVVGWYVGLVRAAIGAALVPPQATRQARRRA